MSKSPTILTFLFLLLATLSQGQSLSNMIIRHSIERSQLRNRVYSQMMFNDMVRDKVRGEAGQASAELPLTHYTKGPSRVIEELVQQTDQDQAATRATLEQSLTEFAEMLQRYGLDEQDYANGIALATVLNYLSYHDESYLDQKGLQLTAAMLRHAYLADANFTKKTDRQKQDEVEEMAIAAMGARLLRKQKDTRAQDMAGQLLQNILGVSPSSITFGSGGFFTTEQLGTTSNKFKQIKTNFTRTNQCLSCEQMAIDQGNTAAYYEQLLRNFDQRVRQSGGATNDLLDMLTINFASCYYMAKNGYTLNTQQLQSARDLILEGFSNPEDQVMHLADERKQIIYETYAIGLIQMEQNYQAGLQKKKNNQRSGDHLDQAWDLVTSTYDPNSLDKTIEKAEQWLNSILYPVVLRDYILTENGFMHR